MKFIMIFFSLCLTFTCGVGGQLLIIHDRLTGFDRLVANTLWFVPLLTAYGCYEFMGRRRSYQGDSGISAEPSSDAKKHIAKAS